MTPPKNLYVPVLPDNSSKKLLFHLNPIVAGTWSSVEIKKAIQLGYIVDKVHSAINYKRHNGPFKDYVATFIKMKIENENHCIKLIVTKLMNTISNLASTLKSHQKIAKQT